MSIQDEFQDLDASRRVPVECEHCEQRFTALKQQLGGIVNCPACGKATTLKGLRDPMWRLFQIGALVIVSGVTVALWTSVGSTAGWIGLGVGVVLLALILLGI